MKQRIREIYQPALRLYVALLILFTLITVVAADIRWAVAEAVAIALALLYVLLSRRSRQKKVDALLDELTYSVESSTGQLMEKFPLPMASIRVSNGQLLWANDDLWSLCGAERQQEAYLAHLIPGLSLRWLRQGESERSELLMYHGRQYRVCGHLSGKEEDVGLLYLLDVTERENTLREYQNSRIVEMVIIVDNYDELLKPLSDRQKIELRGRLDEMLEKWSEGMNGLMRRTDRDRYLFLFERRYLSEIIDGRFSLLEEMHKIETNGGIRATASIGLGVDGDDLAETYSFAALAAEMALTRGGDQAVIKNRSGFEFFGGRGSEVENRDRVHARVVADALQRLMEDASHIYIMGHRYADLDTIGAAAGLCCVARKLNKSARIVLGDGPNAAERLLDRLRDVPEYKDVVIDPASALVEANGDTLLIVVDTNRPEQVEYSPLLERCGRLALIDHHRRAATYIEEPAVAYYEPAASSACELMAELMEKLLEQKDILPQEADAVLSGIVLDTKNFTLRTGEHTFAAAAYLQRCGADTTRVKMLLQNGMEETLARYDILRATRIYRNVAIAVPKEPQNRVVASQAADELLNVHDVTASVVLYPTAAGGVDISARSIGSVNVQVLLEELGGGGNKSAAGAQLKDISLQDATRQLIKAIDHYMDTEQ